jgi:hypothetical protein
MSKLNIAELVVTSFEVGPVLKMSDTNPNDPTPATFCRICPTFPDPGEEYPA